MRMPIFVTALSAVLLVYADVHSWSAVAIVGLACIASAAVSLAAGKWSPYMSGFVAGALIACDALLRHYEGQATRLHDSVTLGDFAYAVTLFTIFGWIAGRMLRSKHVVKGKMEIYDPPRATFVISPAFNRRRLPRASNQ